MLTYINIKNFAIIKELELDLSSEMSCLTGETGAGKSIIIDSLELVLGARSDLSVIGNGADRCEITAIFDLNKLTTTRDWLVKNDLDSEDECIIRRVIAKDGRSKSTINGFPCTQQALRTIGNLLISIHGQHEYQSLTNQDYQLKLLDAFGANQELTRQVKDLYNSWLQQKKELIELENLAEDREEKLDLLTYQFKELEKLDISESNLTKLHEEQKRLSNIEQYSANLTSALEIISENDDSSVIKGLYHSKSYLENCEKFNQEISSGLEMLQNAIIQLEELKNELKSNLNELDCGQERQAEVEEQLDLIYTLARKHRVEPKELMQVKDQLEQQLDNLRSLDDRINQVKFKVLASEKLYLEAARELTTKRNLAASKLNRMVTTKMQELAMLGGKFIANLISNPEQAFSSNGLERVEFLVAVNPGHPPKPLNKVASGGELSRISLAIQVITAEREVVPTLIFDEVDAGIGGKTADMVGQLLRKLSQNTQVICITHLPQIASQAHHQILIEKRINKNSTEVLLTTLNKQERVNEIARMLGGTKITKQTLAHAEELLKSVV